MADELIYRCINEACGRPTPRPVNFCPWCGTAQARAGARAQAAAAPAPVPSTATAAGAATGAAASAAAAGASAAAALSGWSDAPPDGSTGAPSPAPAPSATGFGHSGQQTGEQPAPGPAPPQEVPRPPLAAHPPQRSPIRLRWWLLALVVLWGVWLLAKPSGKKIDRRIDAAIALAHECKASEAQAELIALRKSRATPEQLQRLQQGLNDEAAACTRRRQRGRAWSDASAAVESALAAASWDKARTRLQAFSRRWGEDDATRALQDRIEAARREDIAHREHPLAAPQGMAGAPGANEQQGRSE